MRWIWPVAVLLCLAAGNAAAQQHVKYGTAVKLSPVYYLPVLAAQERGFFKEHDLEVEWVPAQNGPDFIRDLAAGAVQIGSSTGATDIPAIDRGAPAIIVANLQPRDNFAIWVSSAGRIKTIQDLKGAKIGVSRLGGAEHAYGLLVANELKMANDMQFVSSGGIDESLALLQTGGIDGVILSVNQMTDLALQGKVKPVLDIESYKPKPWISYTVTASTDFVAHDPKAAREVLASILEANRFIMSDAGRPWAIAKMKEENHYSDAAAAAIYRTLDFSVDGKIERPAVANVVDFMAKYGLLKPEEKSSVDALYTDRLLP